MRNKFKLILSGGLAGLINGLFGTGGGLVALPLLRACGVSGERANATSLAVVLPLCISSAIVYLFGGKVGLRDVLPYVPGALAGGWLGAKLLPKTPQGWLRLAFGALCLYAAFRALIRG